MLIKKLATKKLNKTSRYCLKKLNNKKEKTVVANNNDDRFIDFISNNVYSKKEIISLNSAAMVLANKINQTRSKKKKVNKAEEA
jgi:hypothetical protein